METAFVAIFDDVGFREVCRHCLDFKRAVMAAKSTMNCKFGARCAKPSHLAIVMRGNDEKPENRIDAFVMSSPERRTTPCRGVTSRPALLWRRWRRSLVLWCAVTGRRGQACRLWK
jgi:hypothetical protein